jgi:predicted HAD superfamily phosphohydrolase
MTAPAVEVQINNIIETVRHFADADLPETQQRELVESLSSELSEQDLFDAFDELMTVLRTVQEGGEPTS